MYSRLELGISLAQVSPDLDFWSDTSDLGWGAHLADKVASGLWSPEELNLFINARKLLAVERGLLQFSHLLARSIVCGQFHDSGVSAQARRDSFSCPQLDCTTDPPLGVVSPDCSCSYVLVDSLSWLGSLLVGGLSLAETSGSEAFQKKESRVVCVASLLFL